MLEHLPPFLTTREVAELIRLKERKVYDLVSGNQIPHVKVTGKLLFPRDQIAAWLTEHTERVAGEPGARVRPAIFAGSHDPLLEWALREARTGLAVTFGGSLDGLDRFAAGEAVAAGMHLSEPGADAWNVTTVANRLVGHPIILIEWARRRQGLIVPEGNPLGICRIDHLKRRRVMARQREAGSFVLLQRLLNESGMRIEDLRLIEPPALTEGDVAAAVLEGRADAGLAIAAVAKQYRVDFVPLIEERYDILMSRAAYFEPPIQKLLAFVRTPRFVERASQIGGYDISGIGTVHYNAP